MEDLYQPTPEDVEEIKTILVITGTKQDSYIKTMLPIMFEEVKDYCNNSFGETETAQPVLPGPVKKFMAKAIEFNRLQSGLKGRTMGSVTYSYETELPEGLYKILNPYRKVRFRALR